MNDETGGFVHAPDETGLVYAWRLDGSGGAERAEWGDLEAAGSVWIHLDASREFAARWLRRDAGVAGWVAEAMITGSSRPRAVGAGEGVLITFRGVNHNPGAEPEDMVRLHAFADERRVITCRSDRLRSAMDLREALEAGRGPRRSGEVVLFLAGNLTRRMGEVVEGIEDDLGTLSDEIGPGARRLSDAGRRLSAERRRIVRLRRYLGPQREAIQRLAGMGLGFFDEADRVRLREIGERGQMRVEDLDALREEASVLDDELKSELGDRQNGRLFVLAVISAVFLPLGLVTGALGMNVGGVPLAGTSLGFWIVLVLMIVVAVGVLIDLRLRGWFGG